ncbi:putative pectinesterase/pectinesterase inhibitor 61 [Cinnamomum micranthum f. kanehirae]|uniref:Pectinesterase n=1 Tax=Cinnamomum micranthum f. kanehirae TaxID=337451 RepID=A0A3S3R9F1_9MAGN|nr:putative pectinesterase/pectinesterase inhibitor 61 [Cinnamomum micranthum f. kanehirae]
MGYGRLGSSESFRSVAEPASNPSNSSKKRKLMVLGLIAFIFLLASGVAAAILVRIRTRGSGVSVPIINKAPTQAISRACGKTRYPDLCVNSLVDFPGAMEAGERDLVHISVNMTLQRIGQALYGASSFTNLPMEGRMRAAYEDCLELLDDSVDQLGQSLTAIAPPASAAGGAGSTDDVLTWLSAALTNQDTCEEGLADVNSTVKDEVVGQMKDLMELVSNCLAIFATTSAGQDFAGVPIQHRRLMAEGEGWFSGMDVEEERRLLQVPAAAIQADIVVSKDGNGTHKTIAEAVEAAPEKSNRRTVIYVKAGWYDENVKVGRKKTNLMFIGDGKGKTVIQGSRFKSETYTTFHTATFAATGAGFIARDMTFENRAGPAKHQAVALRIGADHAVVYHCNVIGYQDTLYVHSQRQFYREVDVYGTVDFIFGNAAVVFQKCNLFARKPMSSQKNTITAQNRKDPNQNTGISIHNCQILPASDLVPVKSSYPTYLGRPWKLYSRTVYLLSYMGDHINPAGWLEWDGNFALDTLYYGEYMNSGPGAAVGKRVRWPGYRVITSTVEASKFTVGQFIFGSSWLPSTGVAFVAGLTV